MSEALFLRLLSFDDKSTMLAKAIETTRTGLTPNSTLHIVDPASFSQIPGSAFAYWVNEQIRHTFAILPPLEGEGRTVKQGLATADDFRFIRLWWEIKPEKIVSGTLKTEPEQFHQQTYSGKRWVPLAKGGAYSPYYSDIHLLVNWEKDGEEIRNFDRAFIRNKGSYFRSGLTWPRRTQRGLSVRVLPAGCIFADKGPVILSSSDSLPSLLGITNSIVFQGLVALQMAFGSYEVGVIQRTPVPVLSGFDGLKLGKLALSCVNMKRDLDRANEISHIFHLPALLHPNGSTLAERVVGWQRKVNETEQQLAICRQEINETSFRLYNIENEDRLAIEESLRNVKSTAVGEPVEAEVEDEDSNIETIADSASLVADLLSYLTGCVHGRWDVRFVTGERPAPELPEPFAPLPVCSPGMLTGDDGLPTTQDRIVSEEWLRRRPDGITLPSAGTVQQPTIQDTQYPIAVAWDGILVDDMDHAADIVRRVREVLTVVWPSEDGAKAEAIEREASEILGVKDLREYFRRQGGFFAHHLKRYSQSRRQAPIYWPLSTASGSYTLWIYYHWLTSDTLFTAVNQYVEPKITEIQRKIRELEGRLTGTTGREATRLREEVEDAHAFLAELQDFRAELLRVAALPYRPDLNDGVIINAAPLHRLFRFPKWAKDTKACWEKLQRGEYDWAHLAYMIWPDRVREKCRADRSIAIAHDLEHLYLEQPTIAQRKRSRKAVPDKEDEE